jgi:hypothetical protein
MADPDKPTQSLNAKPPTVSKAPPPPRTVGGLESPPRPTVSVPKMPYTYPDGFPQSAQMHVLAVRLGAEQVLDEKKSSIRDRADAEALMLDFTLTVFAAFAEKACELGVRRLWTGGDVESECYEFLRRALTGVNLIWADVQTKIERSDEWKRYRRLLRKVADAQAAGGTPPPDSRGTSQPTGIMNDAAGANAGPGGRRYGFAANTDRHNAIAETVGRHDVRWKVSSKAWRRNDATLKSICTELDQGEVDIPESWRTGKTPSLKRIRLKNWSDALHLGFKKLVIDHITYSLDMVLKKAAPAPTGDSKPDLGLR